MADIYSKEKRSNIMSKISGTGNRLETSVRKYLFSKGYRYRKNVKSLPGCPDIVLKKYNTVIFINGCFWHGHDCKAGKLPDTRVDFWKNKIESNLERDKKNVSELQTLGWNVIILWQCEIKDKKSFSMAMNKLNNLIQ